MSAVLPVVVVDEWGDEEGLEENFAGNGFGALWLSFERMAIEATVPIRPENWRALWRNYSTPKVTGDGDDDSWERRALVMRAIDPLLNRPKRKDDSTEPPEDEPKSELVFSKEPLRQPTDYGVWPPRMPGFPARLLIMELRIFATDISSNIMAAVARAAFNRYDVLAPWTDPASKRDTPSGILDRTCGPTGRMLGIGKTEGNIYAPSDTPVRNTPQRLKNDPSVLLLIGAAGSTETFEEFQTGLRTLGIQLLAKRSGGKVMDEEVAFSTDSVLRKATAHSATFVSGELFTEAADKYMVETERRTEALGITTKMSQRAASFEKQLALAKAAIYGPKHDDTLLGLLYNLYHRSTTLAYKACNTSRQLFTSVFGGMDLRMLEWLNVDCVRKLAETDVIEPAVRRRRMRETNATHIELSLLRRTMEVEQSVAFGMLLKLRDVIDAALEAWETRYLTLVITPLFRDIADARGILVEEKSRASQSATGKWKERYTRTQFDSLADHVFRYLLPLHIRARITEYRALAKEHLSSIHGLPREERKATASPLKPPDEQLFKRGRTLYDAMVAVRDMLLPSVNNPSSLVGSTDLLFAAHLKGASLNASVREAWTSSWRGKLTTEQTLKLINGDALPSTNWFKTVARKYSYIDDRINDLGLASTAFSFFASFDDTRDLRVQRQWIGPATSWVYWVRAMPANISPMDAMSTPLPPPISLGEEGERIDWMDISDPKSDVFMTDEDLLDLGITRTKAPTVDLDGITADELNPSNNGSISLMSIAENEALTVPDDAYEAVDAWLQAHKLPTAKHQQYDTPLWHLLRTEVARTYVARFHPLVKQRGPVYRTGTALDNLEEKMLDIENILFDKAMRIDGTPEPKTKFTKTDKAALQGWVANVQNFTGLKHT